MIIKKCWFSLCISFDFIFKLVAEFFFFLKDRPGCTGNSLERRWAPGSSPCGVALNWSALPNERALIPKSWSQRLKHLL